jgi:hypothetical protein
LGNSFEAECQKYEKSENGAYAVHILYDVKFCAKYSKFAKILGAWLIEGLPKSVTGAIPCL